MAPSRRAGPSDLILFEKWMATTQWLLLKTQRFPQSMRHTLSHRIDNLALGILEDLTTAAYSKEPRRHLTTANDRLNRLRVLLRLAQEMKVLSQAQYLDGTAQLAEAGRLLGGWLRPLARAPRQAPPVADCEGSDCNHETCLSPGSEGVAKVHFRHPRERGGPG